MTKKLYSEDDIKVKVPAGHSPAKLKKKLMHQFLAPSAVSKSRLAICRTCEHFSASTQLCGDCKCLMVAKTKLAKSSCPRKKWGPYQQPSKQSILALKQKNNISW